MNKITVELLKLDERAVVPTYAHRDEDGNNLGDVGMDLTAIDVEYDESNDMYIYHTGLAFASEFNVGQFLFLRSSNCKKECYLCNGVGIGDSTIYRGEIQLRMKLRDSLETMIVNETIKTLSTENFGASLPVLYKEVDAKFREKAKSLEFAPYKVGDKVAQMVCLKYPFVELKVVDKLSETVRGTGAFGSTGD